MTEIELLYRTYFLDVYLFIKTLSHDDHIAEEITSETFFKALKQLDSFKGQCEIRVWLCQIAKNTYISSLRKQKKEVSLDVITEMESFENVENLIIEQDTSNEINKYLQQLNEPYKGVFNLRVYAELSFRQIGELFNKSENWACVTYHRARSKIREKMED